MDVGLRVRRYLALARYLRGHGVRASSAYGAPLVRRLRGYDELVMTDGTRLRSPAFGTLHAVFRDVWGGSRYDPPGQPVASDATIIDVGANIGVFTVWAARRVPEGRVLSFEPSAATFPWLECNVALNGLSNVRTIRSAVGGVTGPRRLHHRGPASMNTFYESDNYGSTFATSESVAVVSLDDLFERHAVMHCALLKLDCEGAEYAILMNASPRTLGRIGAIVAEYHLGLNPHTPGELAAFLERRGFRTAIGPPLDEEGGYFQAWRESLA